MDYLWKINEIIGIIFCLCYFYQIVYIPVALLVKEKHPVAKTLGMTRYAILICARNEEKVIGDLIDSIHSQTYPQQYINIFVMADNCQDHTAKIAERHGARVYTRKNQTLVGKGYALDALLKAIQKDHPTGFDGYLVLDSDNILKEDYLEKMNQTFQKCYHIVTSYRNSRNYGDNWISAGYGLWFIRESVFLNQPRCLIKQSCCVGGTGFVFSKTILDQMGGWPYHLLTEDIEFSVDQIIKGYRIGYCPDAILYDEQPITFQQSVDQRLRWAKGFLEVFRDYGGRLIQKIFKGNFSCFDMTMNIMPAFVLSFLGLIVNLMITTLLIVDNGFQWTDLETILSWLLSMYAILFWIGVLTSMTQWKQLHTSCFKKMLYCFSFPVFMFTYLPISLMALFMKVSWKPIQHRGNHLQLSKN